MKFPIKFAIKERAFTTAMVCLATIVVIVLAALQFRWSNQVSEATSIRLADSLQMSMINWHLDFFRDFSEICLTMHIDPENDQRGDGDQYVRRFAEWKARAVYPRLVSDLYLLTSEEGARPRVLRLNPSTRRFEADAQPSNFAPLREKVQQASS